MKDLQVHGKRGCPSNQYHFNRTDYEIAKEELNCFYQFKNSTLYQEYLIYHLNTKPFSAVIFLLLIDGCVFMPATVKSLSLYTSYGVHDRNFVLVLILILVCLSIALFLGCIYLTERLFPKWKIYKRGWLLLKRFRRKYATVYTTEPSTRSLPSIPSFSRRTVNSDFLDHDDEDEDTTNPSKVIYSGHNDYQDQKVEKFRTYGPMSRRVVLLQQFFVLILMILNMLIYTHSAVQEDCHDYSNNTTNALFRNCRADRSPEETSGPRIDVYPILFMFTPVLLSCIFRETLFELQIINHFSVVLILIMTSLYVSYNLLTVIILCVWLFGGYCVLLDLHLHHVAAFLTSYQLREILLEKERNADQAAAAEMRHMIGNVAHDLKTPLSSFTTGLEIIADIIETNEKMIRTLSEDQSGVAVREKRNMANSSPVIPFTSPDDNNQFMKGSTSPPALLEHNQSIKQCLQNIRDTNTFMLMTINRCIDYTKASRGFKLVPKCETLDLLETLRLPLDCMKNIQERVHITLKPIDITEICSHVITDKQWLQENILCLLSNAVKYSTGGEVTISVYLAKAKKNEAIKTKSNNDKMKNPSLNNEPSFTTECTPPVKRASLTERWKKRLSFFDGIFTSFNQSTSTTTKCDNVEEDTSQTPRTAPAANSWKADDTMTRSSILKIKHQKSRLEDIEEGNETSLTKRLAGTDSNTNTNADREEKQGDANVEDRNTTQCTEKNPSKCSDNQSITHVIRFDIEDTGIGMSADAMSQLFSPFRQAQRLAGGTGLGLYSLAKRVEALNGSYGVMKRSDGKQGSLFWFSIPYRPDKTTAELTSSLTGPSKDGGSWDIIKQQTSTSSHYLPRGISLSPPCRRSSLDGGGSFDVMKLPKLKILLVDDSPSIVKMSSMMLKRQGHTVQVADNGEIALQCIQQHWTEHHRGFDVILMDLQMPVMDGLEATRRLRGLEKESPNWLQPGNSTALDHVNREHVLAFSKFCPEYKMSHIHEIWSKLSPAFSYRHAVIGVSANSDDETAKEALQAGVDAFLPKPFSMELFNMTAIKILTKIYDSYHEGVNE